MIQEAYCSYEVAKLLKEKGFNEPCTGLNKILCRDGEKPILRITHQKAMAWLREKGYHIEIFVTWKNDIPHYQWRINNLATHETIVDTPCLNIYEEAVEAACLYSLENLI